MKAALFRAVALGAFLTGPAWAAEPVFDASRLSQHIKVLSSDAYEGRGPATPGETRTVDYITAQFAAAGLQPGGDKVAGGRAWTQDVPLARFEITGPIAINLTSAGQSQALTQGEEVAIRAPQTGVDRLAVKDAPVVFAGYGVTAPERGWDDFKGVDLKGKIALVLVNDPDFEADPDSKTGGDFGGKAMTYYGRWTYKYEEAARRGALGLLVIHETAPASYGWNTVKNSNTQPLFDIIRKDPGASHPALEGWMQRDTAVALFRAAGLDFDAAKVLARRRDFKPVTLSGVTLSADMAVKAETVVTRNIVAVLPGSAHPDERVVYTAHWDHLGIGVPDARGDRIYNGAEDNGAGTAELIELARAFAQAPRTARTVMFLSTTAEEKGLLGSEYYAANPLYPLATTVADINMDGGSFHGPARDVSTAGDAGLTLQDDLIAIAKAHGRYFSPDQNPGGGSFFRSDHFPFAKQGVPAISFKTGQDLVVGGRAAGRAAAAAYTRDKYHQPADEFDPNWDLSGMTQELGILYDLGRQLANSRQWPTWKAGAEFKAARDQTQALRK